MDYKKILVYLLVITFFSGLNAQKRALTIQDLAEWKMIKSTAISPNGEWVSYQIDAEEGDASVHFHQIESSNTYSFPNASQPKVSGNEQWAAFKVSPPRDVVKDLKRQKVKEEKMPADTLAIFNFQSKNIVKLPGLKKFKMLDSLPHLLVFETTAPHIPQDSMDEDVMKPRNKKNGHHVIIWNTTNDQSDTIFYAKKWAVSDHGTSLIAETTAKDSNDIDQWVTYNLKEGKTVALHSGKEEIKQYQWSPDGSTLALIMDMDTTKAYERSYILSLVPSGSSFDEGFVLLDNNVVRDLEVNADHAPSFSKDGQRLFFKHRTPPLVKDTLILDEETVDVEIWTTDDPYIYPMQEKSKDQVDHDGVLSIYNLKTQSLITPGNKEHIEVLHSWNKNGRFLIYSNNIEYAENITWGGHDYKDLTGVDLKDGSTFEIAKKVHGSPRISPKGNWLYWWSFPDTAWMGYDLVNKEKYTWSHNKKVKFYSELHDYPALPWATGAMGFSEDESKFYIYDRYDIWEVKTGANKNMKRVTKGRKDKLRYRWIKLDEESRSIPDDDKLLVHVFDHDTKMTQYGWLDIDKCKVKSEEPEPFFYSFSPKKAKNKNTVLFTKQNYTDFPDLYVATLDNLENAKKITDANPQQEDFYWGNVELITFEVNGQKREGMLVKPDNFDPNKKYPLMVNFYEKSSDRLYRHRRPYLHRSTINYPYYASQGYVIFNPDVNYRVGDPGLSATETVLAGVEHLVKQGFIDEERMALQGHSWGGYQIAHILTKTGIFKCAESGAPVVNMTSAYGGIRWGSGMSRMFQYEKTQSRLGATLWEDQDVYMRNSPLFNLDKVNTPVLILHNDEDGAVPWYQGIEYYMGLRRLGKKAWLLNYRGEPHWPLKYQNRKDFQTRMSQFFNHYMMGADQPEWMKEGVPAHERGINLGY